MTFKRNWSIDFVFDIWWFNTWLWFFIHCFRLSPLQISRLCVYSIYSLSTWFTHSLIFPIFKLGITLTLKYVVEIPSFYVRWLFLLDIHWITFAYWGYKYVLQNFVWFIYLVLFRFCKHVLIFDVLVIWEYYTFLYRWLCIVMAGYLERNLWINYDYKLYFLIGGFVYITNRTLSNFR